MAMHRSIIGGNCDGFFVMLNGAFCTPQFLKHYAQVQVGLFMIGNNPQELLIALDCHLEFPLLVGDLG